MKHLLFALSLWSGACAAAPGPSLQQQPGAAVPLEIAVRDDLGQPARLADFFHPREPVLLVLGYYRCPELCGLVMHSLLEGLHGSGLGPERWRIVGLSIDPQDAPADAHARRERDLAYARSLQAARESGTAPRLDLLVASPPEVQRVAAAIGFDARPEAGGTFAHPATVAVLTPDGKVARYFHGVGLAPAELRTALLDAADGRIGTWTDRLALLCAHLAATPGHHTDAVMSAVRALALVTLAALGFFAWRQARRRG